MPVRRRYGRNHAAGQRFPWRVLRRPSHPSMELRSFFTTWPAVAGLASNASQSEPRSPWSCLVERYCWRSHTLHPAKRRGSMPRQGSLCQTGRPEAPAVTPHLRPDPPEGSQPDLRRAPPGRKHRRRQQPPLEGHLRSPLMARPLRSPRGQSLPSSRPSDRLC